MDKVKMQSMDITADNIEKIGALFREAVTEVKKDGKVTKAIDFDVLKNLLIAGNTEIAEGRKERYEFNWPEKKKTCPSCKSAYHKYLKTSERGQC